MKVRCQVFFLCGHLGKRQKKNQNGRIMKLRNNGIRHLAKNDNGAKANRKGSCY